MKFKETGLYERMMKELSAKLKPEAEALGDQDNVVWEGEGL
jgi:hypothetical protein